MSRGLALPALLCAALFAPVAGAQGTPVRSGEHATFTRLVFPAQSGLRWTEERNAERVVLNFDDPALDFDTSAVFDRIPRSRLAGLETRAGQVALDLACDCAVSVVQIASGHIVIDIAAAEPEPDVEIAPSSDPAPPRLALPLRLDPLQTFGLTPRRAREPLAASVIESPAVAPEGRALPQRSTQISIRTLGRTPLLPAEPLDGAIDDAGAESCAEEAVAAPILRSDPKAALDDLPDLRAGLLDEAGRPVPGAHAALARTYLAAGWGAEASRVLRDAPEAPDRTLMTIADALDGMPEFGGGPTVLNAACGPASALLALLAGTADEGWPNVDETAFARFVDRLPRAAREALVPRLAPALRRLGREELLFLDPPPRVPPSEPLPILAGTDLEAVDATRAALGDGRSVVPSEILSNGLALRASVPAGPLRDELDRALARALVRAGHLTEAETVIGTRADLAEEVLDFALTVLPAEESVPVAMRLRPALTPGGPAARRAGEALQAFGLTSLTRSFGAPAAPSDPAPPAFDTPEDQAWMERDFAALDPESERGQLSSLRQRRNAPQEEGDDFSRAAAALEDSAELAGVLRRLFDPPN